MQDGYLEIVDYVLKNGRERSPREMCTVDCDSVTIFLKNPMRAVPVGIGRGVNLKIGAAETALFIAGVSYPRLLTSITPNFNEFIEFDRLFGAYGPRVYPQYLNLISAFNRDPHTRQAGVAIARPDDITVPTRDTPCTLDVRYAIRDGKLDCNVVMRSNDVIWGLTYDAWVFTAAQCALAYALGVDVGTYSHHAISLHIYVDRDQRILSQLHSYDGSDHPPYPFNPKKVGKIDDHARVARWRYVRNIMEGVIGVRDAAQAHLRFTDVDWYRAQLRDVVQKLSKEVAFCPTCRTFLPLSYFYESDTRALCRWCDKDIRHKLPIGTYFRMMIAQDGRCAICDKIADLVLDHDHDTGLARGLLCDPCNKALGLLYDQPKSAVRAAQYLDLDGVNANEWTLDYGFLYRARPRDEAVRHRLERKKTEE